MIFDIVKETSESITLREVGMDQYQAWDLLHLFKQIFPRTGCYIVCWDGYENAICVAKS